MDNFKEWIGKEISRSDIITPRLVDHLKKTLEPNILANDEIPQGLFLCLCPDVVDSNSNNSGVAIFVVAIIYIL